MKKSRNEKRRWSQAAVAVLLSMGFLLSASACNEVSFLRPPPYPRGITIPVPPPSFTSETEHRFDVEGDLPPSEAPDATRVELFEKTTGRGYYTHSVGGSWFIPEVLVDLDDHCLTVTSRDETQEISSEQDFKLILETGDACEPGCSAPDDEGNCVCIEFWNSGC